MDEKVQLNITAKEHFQLQGKIVNQKVEFNIVYFGIEFFTEEAQINKLFDKLLIDIDMLDWSALGISR